MVRKTSSRNTEKEEKDELLKRLKELLDLPELPEADLDDYLRIEPKYATPFQAFVPIQIGCDKYCTYCIVPYSRGREKSRPMPDILEECRKLVESGCKEITLVGQTVNSYGLSMWDKKSGQFSSMKEPFITLLEEIDKLSSQGLNRLRFTSPHPRDFTDTLIQAHARLTTSPIISICRYRLEIMKF